MKILFAILITMNLAIPGAMAGNFSGVTPYEKADACAQAQDKGISYSDCLDLKFIVIKDYDYDCIRQLRFDGVVDEQIQHTCTASVAGEFCHVPQLPPPICESHRILDHGVYCRGVSAKCREHHGGTFSYNDCMLAYGCNPN